MLTFLETVATPSGEGGQDHVAPGDGDLTAEAGPLAEMGSLRIWTSSSSFLPSTWSTLPVLTISGSSSELVEHGVLCAGNGFLGELAQERSLGPRSV